MTQDKSNGYDAIVADYMEARSSAGREVVQNWAASLTPGSTIVDVGCGTGLPLTPVLLDQGLNVFAMDAAPSMIAIFRQHFPEIETACEAAEESSFFGRRFDAALSIGLIFLLSPAAQKESLRRICQTLPPGGSLLFSAPWQVCKWDDLLTGQTSQSLGKETYTRLLDDYGMNLIAAYEDEGSTHYFEARKRL
ncbi:MAG: class I SAM-dependent methyltransferase [Aquisalinus sp.]|nr:class I SAM-dependent methyltransferase [Aquisalinus sp.]